MKRIASLVILLCLAGNGTPLLAGELSPDGPDDHLAVATLMVYDGLYDKARAELALVDPSVGTVDLAEYYTIKGVLEAKTENNQSAIAHYLQAVKATEGKNFQPPAVYQEGNYLFALGKHEEAAAPTPVFDGEAVRREKLEKLYIHLSQAFYKLEDYANTVKSLDLAGASGRDRAELFALRAECFWKSKAHHQALAALQRGAALFPANTDLLKQKFYYLVELGLYQAAILVAEKYMAVSEADENEYLTLAQVFLRADQLNEAIEILERAGGKFPQNAKVLMLLGHAYMRKEMLRTTAHLFKLGAYRDQTYLKDAVEMHRRVGDYPQAIFLNSQITDKVEKLKQKVAIYLDRGEFAKIIGLEDALERYDILNDDNMRYAFAYSCYMVNDYQNAELQLAKITDQELFVKGTAIRNNIDKCRNDRLECM